jgi:hypothetical protein
VRVDNGPLLASCTIKTRRATSGRAGKRTWCRQSIRADIDNGENEGGRCSRERAAERMGGWFSDTRPDESHAGPRGTGRNRGSNGEVDKLSGLDRGPGESPTRISLPHAQRGKAGSSDGPKIAEASAQEASPSAPFLAVTALCHSSRNLAAKTGVQVVPVFPFPERLPSNGPAWPVTSPSAGWQSRPMTAFLLATIPTCNSRPGRSGCKLRPNCGRIRTTQHDVIF